MCWNFTLENATVKISNRFEFLSIFLFISASWIPSYKVCSKTLQVSEVKRTGSGLLTDIHYKYTAGFLVFFLQLCRSANSSYQAYESSVNPCATLKWKSPSIFTGTYLGQEFLPQICWLLLPYIQTLAFTSIFDISQLVNWKHFLIWAEFRFSSNSCALIHPLWCPIFVNRSPAFNT